MHHSTLGIETRFATAAQDLQFEHHSLSYSPRVSFGKYDDAMMQPGKAPAFITTGSLSSFMPTGHAQVVELLLSHKINRQSLARRGFALNNYDKAAGIGASGVVGCWHRVCCRGCCPRRPCSF